MLAKRRSQAVNRVHRFVRMVNGLYGRRGLAAVTRFLKGNGEIAMKTVNVEARLEYARATVAVLRALQILNSTMRYGELARAIGLMSAKEPWGVGTATRLPKSSTWWAH